MFGFNYQIESFFLIKIIHKKADIYGIYTNEIEVVGFFAGSHLSILLGL